MDFLISICRCMEQLLSLDNDKERNEVWDMGVCKICGEKYGLMSGGTEPYTGCNLTICNSCGQILKDIEQSKGEDTKEVKELCTSIMDMAQDEEVRNILSEYSEKIIGESENLVAKTNESKERAERIQHIENNFADLEKSFMVTTGYEFEGYRITAYRGIASGDIVLGTGFLSEFVASWSDAFGTTSNTFAGKMKTAKDNALKELISNAMIEGANAAIGVTFNYTMFNNNMLGVSANGTAVVIEEI